MPELRKLLARHVHSNHGFNLYVMEINLNISGFIKSPEYTAYMHELIKDYEDKFTKLEMLNLEIEEIPYSMLEFAKRRSIEFTEDGKVGTVRLKFSKIYTSKGKVKSTPTPRSVLGEIKSALNASVDKYKEGYLRE